MTNPAAYTVRDIAAADAQAWADLYAGYLSFYGVPADAAAVAVAWGWLLGRRHGMHGIVAATPDGEIVALANLRLFARPSRAVLGLYLDDLFTLPTARGTGAAGALLHRAAEIAAEEGADVVRWITAGDNERARRVYDAHAIATPWVTYDMKPADG
jgi:GNAT superfamily N-acetyltransferase